MKASGIVIIILIVILAILSGLMAFSVNCKETECETCAECESESESDPVTSFETILDFYASSCDGVDAGSFIVTDECPDVSMDSLFIYVDRLNNLYGSRCDNVNDVAADVAADIPGLLYFVGDDDMSSYLGLPLGMEKANNDELLTYVDDDLKRCISADDSGELFFSEYRDFLSAFREFLSYFTSEDIPDCMAIDTAYIGAMYCDM